MAKLQLSLRFKAIYLFFCKLKCNNARQNALFGYKNEGFLCSFTTFLYFCTRFMSSNFEL